MTTRPMDDETLSLWLDGALAEDEAADVEAAIARDPALARRLEQFAAQDAEVRAQFDEWLEPVPASLEASVRNGFAVRRASSRAGTARWWFLAAAAVAVIAVGMLGFDRVIDSRVDAALERMRAERASDLAFVTSAMQKVLESRPSGTRVALRNPTTGLGVTLLPRRTWKSASGHWCREFVEIFPGIDPAKAPVSTACRTGKGVWSRVGTKLIAPTEPFLPRRPRDADL